MTLWFTADEHLDHGNIIKHCSRPFENVNQMNQTIITNFNSVVGPKDMVYHLGDFIWKHNWSVAINFFKKLNGNHRVMEGNHDKYIRNLRNNENPHTKVYEPFIGHKVQIIEPFKEIKWIGQRISLCHYALATWPAAGRGAWMLHGHSHGNLKFKHGKILDVGVDVHNYFPINFDQVKEYMETRQFCQIDHHKERK